MSAAATAPRVRSLAECRADEIVAAFERCTDGDQVRRVMERAQPSMDRLAALADLTHWRRASQARANAYQRHCRPEPEGPAEEDQHA